MDKMHFKREVRAPVLGHERASHGGECCLPPAAQREKGSQCPVCRVKGPPQSEGPQSHEEAKEQTRRKEGPPEETGQHQALARPELVSRLPPGSAPRSPGCLHSLQDLFKTDIRSQAPWMQNRPVESISLSWTSKCLQWRVYSRSSPGHPL